MKAGDTFVIDSPEEHHHGLLGFCQERQTGLLQPAGQQELAKELYQNKALALKDLKQPLIKARAETRRAKERLLSPQTPASELDKPLAQQGIASALRHEPMSGDNVRDTRPMEGILGRSRFTFWTGCRS